MLKRIILSFLFYFSNGLETINLNNENLILIKNEINSETVSYAIEKIQTVKNASNMIIFIDSPGGNVEHGLLLMNELHKYNITCIANKAYSMAFAILQSCANRYILPTAKLMQHQITFGIKNSLKEINNYVSYVNQINNYLTILQSNKINMHPLTFLEKTSSDWWIFGENIIIENVADKIVNVECSKKLLNTNYTQNVGNIKIVYSNCPLVFKEKQVNIIKNIKTIAVDRN